MKNKHQEISFGWILASIFIFLGAEVILGGFVGEFILGAYLSPMWHLKAQMILNLTAYLAGGFLVGVLSPGVRLIEPAIAGFVSVLLTGLSAFFLPYTFVHFGSNLYVGGAIAFVLSLVGAYSGERMMRNVD